LIFAKLFSCCTLKVSLNNPFKETKALHHFTKIKQCTSKLTTQQQFNPLSQQRERSTFLAITGQEIWLELVKPQKIRLDLHFLFETFGRFAFEFFG